MNIIRVCKLRFVVMHLGLSQRSHGSQLVLMCWVLLLGLPHYINHMNDIECEICEPICNISKPKHHRLCSSSSSPSILEHRFLWEAELLQHLPKPEQHHLCNGHAWAWIQDDHSSKHTSNAKVRILSLFCTQKSRFWNAPAMWTSGTLLLRGCPHSVPALSRCPSL